MGCDKPRGLPLILRFYPGKIILPEISPASGQGTLILVNSYRFNIPHKFRTYYLLVGQLFIGK